MNNSGFKSTQVQCKYYTALLQTHDLVLSRWQTVQVSRTSFSYEKLVETCIQVAHRTIQVSRTRNMADDTDNDLAVAATTVLSA